MTVRRKRGDTTPIEAQLFRAGKVIPLTGASVRFLMRPVVTGEGQIVMGPAAIVDATRGKVVYNPVPLDVAAAGVHRAEFEVTFGDGSILTFPNGDADSPEYLTIEILPDLG